MEKQIALLRGINISGNVLFSSNNNDCGDVAARCKAMIEERFMLDVPVVIISQKELSEALDHAPDWWDTKSDEEGIHQAIFLISPATVRGVYEAVGEAKPEYEQVGSCFYCQTGKPDIK